METTDEESSSTGHTETTVDSRKVSPSVRVTLQTPANFPEDVVDSLPKDFSTGVYYGWACVNGGAVHKMVMSVGWNPFYHNTKRSMETYIMHKFKDDFYDSILKLCLLGYIRPEKNFDGLDELIAAIQGDIQHAEGALEQPDKKQFQSDNFFRTENNSC
ncbi:Riboflavin kinase [Lamellibrachia satsuma]|nr:Riboflavin kinase [Lamellibrachia satsuma]